MATPAFITPKNVPQAEKTLMAGYLFGAPMGDLGWFVSLLMSFGAGMATFFAGTFAGIVWIMVSSAGHSENLANMAWSYERVGLPLGVVAMVVTGSYLGMLWVRRISRKA